MSNKSLEKANTNLHLDDFKLDDLNKIGIVLNELNIPFKGFESINLEKIISNLKSSGEVSILSTHQGFDSNRLYFNLRDEKIRVEVEANSFYVNGGDNLCSDISKKFYHKIFNSYLK